MNLAINDHRLAKPGPQHAALRDYDSVRRAIAFISERWRAQPTIESMADAAAVTPSELRVRRVSHRGHVVEWVLNPLWVQLDQKTHAEFGIEKLYLVSKGRRVSIASFLGPDEKASFAKVLLAALQAARRGPTYNPLS